jgi:hypothetical protein
MAYTPGEQWIRLLRGYAPVAENSAMTAEHIGRLEKRTGIPPIRFPHPGREKLFEAVLAKGDLPKNVILTGTAGEGKTTLCYELFEEIAGRPPNEELGFETIPFQIGSETTQITFIYDVTGWRQIENGHLLPEQVAVLARFARSVFDQNNEFFVIAVNDGQLHEIFAYLPDQAPEELAKLHAEVSQLHSKSLEISQARLRLINLSNISNSEVVMQSCLSALLERKEWRCFQDEANHPLFAPSSSLYRNYQLLRSPAVRGRLVTLAQIADAAGYHMSIRGVLCLLSNALLGNPAARDGVLRPTPGIGKLLEQEPHRAALHRTFFGDHLSPVARNKREVYRLLTMLQIGAETTNDLDELLIFGPFDPRLQETYEKVVAPDPYAQRNPELAPLAREYVRGELTPEDTAKLLRELAAERRRLFLTADEEAVAKLNLWHTSVFHFAGDYIQKVLNPVRSGHPVAHTLLQRIIAGLNRAWTGLLLSTKPDELYLCTGLDVTTATVSDVLCAQIDIAGNGNSRIEVRLCPKTKQPVLLIEVGPRNFEFRLTLTRFEFLCRVADGTMPGSFSRESAEDFAMLKQRCIAAIAPTPNPQVINGIRITPSGKIERAPIHLPLA